MPASRLKNGSPISLSESTRTDCKRPYFAQRPFARRAFDFCSPDMPTYFLCIKLSCFARKNRERQGALPLDPGQVLLHPFRAWEGAARGVPV